MDYFLMNETIFKLLIKEQPLFINNLFKSININLENYNLFDINIPSSKTKIDILFIGDKSAINIQFNKNKESLKRNKIYIESISKILYNYSLIQINFNLFELKNKYYSKSIKILNYHKTDNEYISFLTSKNFENFKTSNKIIQKTIFFLKNLNKSKLLKQIYKEQEIKKYLDNLIKD